MSKAFKFPAAAQFVLSFTAVQGNTKQVKMIPWSPQWHFRAPELYCNKLVKVQVGEELGKPLGKHPESSRNRVFFFSLYSCCCSLTLEKKETALKPRGSGEGKAIQCHSTWFFLHHIPVTVSPLLPTVFPPRKTPNGLMHFLSQQKMLDFSCLRTI